MSRTVSSWNMKFNSPEFRRLTLSIFGYALLTGIHAGVLYLLLYLDNHFILSETWITVLSIPVGLINCAVLLTGFMRLKGFTTPGILYFFFALINFALYIAISLNLYSQAGSMTN